MASSDLEPTQQVELVQFADAKELAELLSGLVSAGEPTEEEMEAMRFSIILEMAAAETEEDLWREVKTWSSKDVVGTAFEIRDARAWRSKYPSESGKTGAFLSCPAVNLDTGEVGILNTSAMRLSGRIGWYKIHGQLPVQLRVVQVSESSRGRPIIDGRRIEEPVDTTKPGDPEVIEDAEFSDVDVAATA